MERRRKGLGEGILVMVLIANGESWVENLEERIEGGMTQ